MSDYRRQLAFQAGREARLSGKEETANNRPEGTIFYDDWQDGWNESNEAALAKLGQTP